MYICMYYTTRIAMVLVYKVWIRSCRIFVTNRMPPSAQAAKCCYPEGADSLLSANLSFKTKSGNMAAGL